ncbi:SigE family RNA polymerase sigma factor [Micromonospora soli]|uniref:RNA polymerase sigma factor n=1 Tax=Micromonospora sp. NBRC 110009 TaxID=3061627 RepID=UPI002672B01A|nr:SigE family RNA polymerase sigma factor [Micromonospora sp. NBRC 110009]WKT97853.1 SigE family RNA polymerase sigma factor [Micromonospora sp. NBRC 110009]
MDPQEQVRQVYAASAARLVAQLYAMTGDYAEAQDVVQEAFVRALARPGRFRQVANPEAWLRTVALNVARSRYRRRAFLHGLVRSGRLDPAQRTAPDLSPDHVALVAALQRLPRQARETVVLHHLADLPVSEVAAVLGCSVEAVKTRLVRARRALADHLGDAAPAHLIPTGRSGRSSLSQDQEAPHA